VRSKAIRLIHVDAGVRSFDRTSRWESNRVSIDQLSDVLLTADRGAVQNLTQEGVRSEQIQFVGHLLSDALLAALPLAVEPTLTLREAGVTEAIITEGSSYGLVGINCPPDLSDRKVFEEIVSMLRKFSKIVPLIWPITEQNRTSFEKHGLMQDLDRARLVVLPPLEYLKMLGLIKAATCVITDARAMQDEASTLGVPCLTLRPDANRRVTVELGSNSVVGFSVKRLMAELSEILDNGGKGGLVPELWDGHVASRIAEQIYKLHTGKARVSAAAPSQRAPSARSSNAVRAKEETGSAPGRSA